ncbi:MAG: hypothetical protein WAU39_12315 [Polyangiales bacterium]
MVGARHSFSTLAEPDLADTLGHHGEGRGDYVLLKVHNATSCEAPYTAERLKRAAFFSMLEDWHLEDDAGVTKLTRLWRDFEQHGLKMAPVRPMVQLTAKLESRAIRKHWATTA